VGVDPVMNRAVFLDRDGVLNRALVHDGRPYPPLRLEELEILPGVLEALDVLRRSGYRLICVTNQPDVARGQLTVAQVDIIHRHLQTKLKLDAIYMCPHDDDDRCACRKPAPGMLKRGAAEWQVDLTSSYMVGDRWRDIEAGRKAGCTTILVDYGYAEVIDSEPDKRVASLAEAVTWIVAQHPS
jgi:D-glycero-D-manno-heptose 1,7-bisphosphate phosphatase